MRGAASSLKSRSAAKCSGAISTPLNLITAIAKREGIGDILADGVRAAAAKFEAGVEKFAIHVKGLESGADMRRGGRPP